MAFGSLEDLEIERLTPAVVVLDVISGDGDCLMIDRIFPSKGKILSLLVAHGFPGPLKNERVAAKGICWEFGQRSSVEL